MARNSEVPGHVLLGRDATEIVAENNSEILEVVLTNCLGKCRPEARTRRGLETHFPRVIMLCWRADESIFSMEKASG